MDDQNSRREGIKNNVDLVVNSLGGLRSKNGTAEDAFYTKKDAVTAVHYPGQGAALKEQYADLPKKKQNEAIKAEFDASHNRFARKLTDLAARMGDSFTIGKGSLQDLGGLQAHHQMFEQGLASGKIPRYQENPDEHKSWEGKHVTALARDLGLPLPKDPNAWQQKGKHLLDHLIDSGLVNVAKADEKDSDEEAKYTGTFHGDLDTGKHLRTNAKSDAATGYKSSNNRFRVDTGTSGNSEGYIKYLSELNSKIPEDQRTYTDEDTGATLNLDLVKGLESKEKARQVASQAPAGIRQDVAHRLKEVYQSEGIKQEDIPEAHQNWMSRANEGDVTGTLGDTTIATNNRFTQPLKSTNLPASQGDAISKSLSHMGEGPVHEDTEAILLRDLNNEKVLNGIRTDEGIKDFIMKNADKIRQGLQGFKDIEHDGEKPFEDMSEVVREKQVKSQGGKQFTSYTDRERIDPAKFRTYSVMKDYIDLHDQTNGFTNFKDAEGNPITYKHPDSGDASADWIANAMAQTGNATPAEIQLMGGTRAYNEANPDKTPLEESKIAKEVLETHIPAYLKEQQEKGTVSEGIKELSALNDLRKSTDNSKLKDALDKLGKTAGLRTPYSLQESSFEDKARDLIRQKLRPHLFPESNDAYAHRDAFLKEFRQKQNQKASEIRSQAFGSDEAARAFSRSKKANRSSEDQSKYDQMKKDIEAVYSPSFQDKLNQWKSTKEGKAHAATIDATEKRVSNLVGALGDVSERVRTNLSPQGQAVNDYHTALAKIFKEHNVPNLTQIDHNGHIINLGGHQQKESVANADNWKQFASAADRKADQENTNAFAKTLGIEVGKSWTQEQKDALQAEKARYRKSVVDKYSEDVLRARRQGKNSPYSVSTDAPHDQSFVDVHRNQNRGAPVGLQAKGEAGRTAGHFLKVQGAGVQPFQTSHDQIFTKPGEYQKQRELFRQTKGEQVDQHRNLAQANYNLSVAELTHHIKDPKELEEAKAKLKKAYDEYTGKFGDTEQRKVAHLVSKGVDLYALGGLVS